MNRPAQPAVQPALDARFGIQTEVRLAELRRLVANLQAAEEILAGRWPVAPRVKP